MSEGCNCYMQRQVENHNNLCYRLRGTLTGMQHKTNTENTHTWRNAACTSEMWDATIRFVWTLKCSRGQSGEAGIWSNQDTCSSVTWRTNETRQNEEKLKIQRWEYALAQPLWFRQTCPKRSDEWGIRAEKRTGGNGDENAQEPTH